MALAVVFLLVVVVDGFLFYSREPAKSVATLPMKPTVAPLPNCYASEVDFHGDSVALDERNYAGMKVGGLSGLAYDPNRGLYYALADSGVETTPARFYTLKPLVEQRRLTDLVIEDVTILRDPRGKPFTGSNFDGEGIAVTSEGELLISSEVGPSIRRFSLDGGFLAKLQVPQKFLVAPEGYAQVNATFEGLALSPNGRSLFTANEQPLDTDGQAYSEERQRVRLLRYEARGSSEFEPTQEYFYLTEEPGQSLSAIAALSESELLILERSEHQILRVSLDDGEDVSDEESLAASSTTPLGKELVVDVDDYCPVSSDGTNSFGLLEGMSLGAELPGGRRELLLQSDDDFKNSQKTHTILLSMRVE